MRELLNICDDFAAEFDVVFNAPKAKCLVFKPFTGRSISSTNFHIGGKEIEFVDSWPHLGHILNVSKDDGANMYNILKCYEWPNKQCKQYFGFVSCYEA